jgi:hypothetical protein
VTHPQLASGMGPAAGSPAGPGDCPGPADPDLSALFRQHHAGQGIAYSYVANAGHYSVQLNSVGDLPAPATEQVQGGTFFIGPLPKSACAYSSMELNATARFASDVHQLGVGTCQPNKLVTIQTSQGAWQTLAP